MTGNLVETRLGIAKSKIKRLPMNEQVQVGNVFVTLLEANHCPGHLACLACIFSTKTSRLRVAVLNFSQLFCLLSLDS